MAKVLVVDDELDLREIIADELRAGGFEVVEASGGHAAWALIQKEKFQCVLSDVRMPQGDGKELLKRVQTLPAADRPVFFLMSGFTDFTEEEAVTMGARKVFAKPFDLSQISQEITTAVGSSGQACLG